jgi:hypothetical protein
MKILALAALTLAIAITGCKSTVPQAITTVVTLPSIGEVAISYLGENLITQGIGYYTDVITVGNMIKYTASFKEAIYSNIVGTIIFEADNYSVGINNLYGTEVSRTKFLAYDKADNEVCITQNPWVAYPLWMANCFDTDEVNIFRAEKQELVFTKDSLRQHIKYEGKSGYTLKFTYSEFTDVVMAGDAVASKFTIDLSKGNSIVYKGSRFEVIEATNSFITYEIIKPFS